MEVVKRMTVLMEVDRQVSVLTEVGGRWGGGIIFEV